MTTELGNVTKQLEVAQTNAKVEAAPTAGSPDEVKDLQSQVKEQARFLASKESELNMIQSKMQKLCFERDDAVAKMMRIRRDLWETSSMGAFRVTAVDSIFGETSESSLRRRRS